MWSHICDVKENLYIIIRGMYFNFRLEEVETYELMWFIFWAKNKEKYF